MTEVKLISKRKILEESKKILEESKKHENKVNFNIENNENRINIDVKKIVR